MPILGVIPARYASTRFPGKPLVPIAGRPMIEHVYQRAAGCQRLDRVLVATDDRRIVDCVRGFGGEVMLTSSEHPSGTDRLGEVAEQLPDYEYYVNIQGDEPLLEAEAIDALLAKTLAVAAPMSTLVRELDAAAEQAILADPHVVKVARGADGRAVYFSRAAVPYPRRSEHARYYKHIGIYAYRREVLLDLCQLPPAPLELAEGLEQLRALENGIFILAVITDYDPIGVDVPEDLAQVESRLNIE